MFQYPNLFFQKTFGGLRMSRFELNSFVLCALEMGIPAPQWRFTYFLVSDFPSMVSSEEIFFCVFYSDNTEWIKESQVTRPVVHQVLTVKVLDREERQFNEQKDDTDKEERDCQKIIQIQGAWLHSSFKE